MRAGSFEAACSHELVDIIQKYKERKIERRNAKHTTNYKEGENPRMKVEPEL